MVEEERDAEFNYHDQCHPRPASKLSGLPAPQSRSKGEELVPHTAQSRLGPHGLNTWHAQ
ncbi:uncharacterized protein PGTG_19314 [Puccinia graminis f. sp. tritici CRL 75-36-700-3]|uniref:Uncharacterized protein n=1 Tax=Puccinia graminis f. sp. tritici (strain CRL 75-36-700-3 / race SCCL) TaxID=418459 RepID=E3L9P2_PUCGT|nr:uncharacterized protein PGTG_19314 [Puccinia graminis f. sp. tritici CRL 75-36-700-3]EFP93267.1 hypothetical protein PGTG_19314 [Puccinia graminis f. sp. tritici CRL 75-36-700-3]